MEANGICLGYQAFTPPLDLELKSVEFYRNLSGASGSVKIVQGKLCTIDKNLGSTNTAVAVAGWNEYTFDRPIKLRAGITYFLATNSGVVCADYSNEDSPHIGPHYFENPDCINEMGLTVRINGRSWVDLH